MEYSHERGLIFFTTRRNELKKMGNDEWEPSGLGLTIFQDRYARSQDETWQEACRRVADHVAAAEENGKFKRYGDRFFDQLRSNKFMPGGRIWYGAGRSKAQLLNCFVIPVEDSREGWGKTTSDTIVISGMMGGIGMDVSPVRPRGYEIRGTGGYATGSVSFAKLINGVGDIIVGGGGRRMALMIGLNINHPDIEEFLKVKLDLEELNNANISVILPMDTNEFINMVTLDEEIDLVFNGLPSGRTISARWVWEKLVDNAWTSGEPGVLNAYLANKMNSISYYRDLICTNPCGEIWLEPYGCCCLGALVLPQFVKDGGLDWDALDESVRLGVRFLDDVLTVNHYPLEEIRQNCENLRRIGLGAMGLHTMLLELGMKYDDEESFEFVDKLFSFIKNVAYDASINLAIEKGPFSVYDPKYLDQGFSKTLKRGVRGKIREHGIRNCAVLTMAPTGTTSMVSWSATGCSSSAEPYPPAIYERSFYKPTKGESKGELVKEVVVDEAYYKYGDLLQSAIDVPVESHFRMQKILQSHIDNAVSKTINLAKDFPKDEFGDIWLKYLPYLKGTTIYRYGSRENEPISPIPKELWNDVIASRNEEAEQMTADEFMALDCPDGVCEVPYAKELAVV